MSAFPVMEDLGLCTMTGCLEKAVWVHGLPMVDGSGREFWPWRLCNCCQESVLAADQLLHGDVAVASGIVDAEEIAWMLELTRTDKAQLLKQEARK